MTVYELIQELVNYEPEKEVRFLAEFYHSAETTINDDCVTVKVGFDGYLDVDEFKTYWSDDELIIKLTY